MGTLAEDVQSSAEWISKALSSSGYRADFSLSSLKEIDRFFDEQSRHGEPVPGGLLAEKLGARMLAIGGYIGETIRRARGGRWEANDQDPEGEINIAVVLSGGEIIWPVQRAMKRFKNGAEDGIYAYGLIVGERADPNLSPPPSRPWWKIW